MSHHSLQQHHQRPAKLRSLMGRIRGHDGAGHLYVHQRDPELQCPWWSDWTGILSGLCAMRQGVGEKRASVCETFKDHCANGQIDPAFVQLLAF